MGITTSKNNVAKIRPEQHVYFRYTIDYRADEDLEYLRKRLVKPDYVNNDSNDIRSVLNEQVGIRSNYYFWSLEQGYVSPFNDDLPTNATVFDIEDHSEIKIMLPSAVLARLSKITGFDYLADGHYSLEYFNLNDMLLVPKHWLTRVIIISNVAKLKYNDGKLYYDQFRMFGSSETIVATGPLDEILCRPTIDIVTVTGIGIKYSKRMCKLCDIVIACHHVCKKRKRFDQ